MRSIYLSSEQCGDWDITGLERLKNYLVHERSAQVESETFVEKDQFKFDFDLHTFADEDEHSVRLVIECSVPQQAIS